jgi:hypothetical protein
MLSSGEAKPLKEIATRERDDNNYMTTLTSDIVAVLSAPHIVQSVWDRTRTIRPDQPESEVVLPMQNLAGLW